MKYDKNNNHIAELHKCPQKTNEIFQEKEKKLINK